MSDRYIIEDSLNASDYIKYNWKFSCEDCSYFCPKTVKEAANCSLGQDHTPHLKENLIKRYNLNGKIAFCKYIEID